MQASIPTSFATKILQPFALQARILKYITTLDIPVGEVSSLGYQFPTLYHVKFQTGEGRIAISHGLPFCSCRVLHCSDITSIVTVAEVSSVFVYSTSPSRLEIYTKTN